MSIERAPVANRQSEGMPVARPASMDRLLAEALRYLETIDEPPVRDLRLTLARGGARNVTPQPLPVLDWLDPALDTVRAKGALDNRLLAALAAAADRLSWHQSYTADEIGDRFLERYGWSELVGPRGPIYSDSFRCGFLVLGPHIEYPSHAHGPQEIYWPLTDASYWQTDTPQWTRGIPHRPIRHPAWMPHAMRTGDTPLVALYLWYDGDVSRKPSFAAQFSSLWPNS